jgi:ribonuclease HII
MRVGNTITETVNVVKVTCVTHNGGMSRVISPTQTIERQLRTQGFAAVAGVDEAGAGALAGPVVAGAVVWQEGVSGRGIRDSKTLSLAARERLYDLIVEQSAAWASGVATVEEIAELGIRPANLLAMRRAVEALQPKPDFVLVDAWTIPELIVPQKGIIRADQKILCVAAASIVAKVTRDRMMIDLHTHFPLYGFDQHKGYGTQQHQAVIEKYGPCEAHRTNWKIFQPKT